MKLKVPFGNTVESVGNEVLVCDRESSRVHRLSGGARDLFLRVVEAGTLEVASDDETAAAMLEAGVLATDGMSRRTAMGLAAAAAATGIVTTVLPAAAAAQSPTPSGGFTPIATGTGEDPNVVSSPNDPGLSAPTSLQAFPDDTQVYLSWQPVEGADSYQVLYRAGASGPYLIASETVDITSVLVTGLDNGTEYEFAVRTRVAGQLSAPVTVAATPLVIATGGTISSYTDDGVTYRVHSFTTGGDFVLNATRDVEYLVVGGGGSGGTAGSLSGCGGGGAGGFRTGTFSSLAASTYGVTVGAGGLAPATSGNDSVQGVNGGASEVNSISAAGGGGGGRFNTVGNSGGSGGGGGGRDSTAGGAGTTPATDPSQGNHGGAARSGDPTGRSAGGGGGGAGAPGGNGATDGKSIAGNGAAGRASSITGTSVTYAGGGGGGARDTQGGTQTAGTGGAGGGGNGSLLADASAGTNGLGGGGGGAGSQSANQNIGRGGDGGSGVVILAYAVNA